MGHHRVTAWRWAWAVLLLPLAGCANHSFAPGPGMSAAQFEPDSARCRLMSRGMMRPQAVYAPYHRDQYAAAAAVTLISAIGGAVEQNQNFNDCMIAQGWQPSVGPVTPASGPLGARLAEAPAPAMPAPILIADGPIAPAPTARPRRNFGAEVLPIAVPFNNPTLPRGAPSLVVVDIHPGGAAEAAGLRRGDIILSFANTAVPTVASMQGALHRVGPGHAVPIELWRDQAPVSTAARF